jgi:hypothetical protein
MRIDVFCFALWSAFLPSCVVLGAVTVHHPELNFSLNLPDEFERIVDDERPNDFVRVYRQIRPAGPIAVVVAIERLHGVLARPDMTRKPPTPQVELTTEQWKGFDIVVGRVAEELNGTMGVVFNAQVPLKPEGIQIKVMGPITQESQLRSLLRDMLATLTGETNWLSTEERSQRLLDGTTRMGVTIAAIAFFAIFVISRFKKTSRPSGGGLVDPYRRSV